MINENEKLGFWTFLFLWFGAAVSAAEILTGGLIAPLGFKIGIIVILIGHLIGTGILILGGIIGTREKVPAMTSTNISFGVYSTYLFSLLNILQLLGWTAIMIKVAANSVNLISQSLWKFDNVSVFILLIGVLTMLWLYFGNAGMKKLNITAVTLLFILTLVLGTIIFKDKTLLLKASSKGVSFGGALELSVIMPLSWLPLIADYTRFAKSEKGGAYGIFIGYFLGSSWMFIIGLGAAIVSNNSDPSAMMLAVNLGFAALGIVVLSTVTTTFLDVYSAGVSFLNIMPKLSEKKVGIVMTILGTLAAIIFPMGNYESFLYAIGSLFAPLFAILITDYFIIKKNTKVQSSVLINFGAILVWIMGIVIYYSFIKLDLILGATVPVMIITGFIYAISWRVTCKWKLIKK
ncbi:putative hydroxymethylpyrimidine transporter CytX [Clostridium bowmanii]|uniref:putative hydroxymethylpyrimidine transporter CytX n=1 Tax=Clostridium bowmanii TaxID=132925 RepID=UPI001C0B105B|nr:putative hydroxymethylpyrimidine transporter CytX [Clostridium bowmanii]MBU3190477.1 putative hydroxymethylpyrimidine transporter CytX [Clostridium bowmanii]MCA1074461.1 putative hydroxymethylpyrimidine transporter CytX [Clostridium bowmanii]